MDDYTKIQQIFEDLYSRKIENKLNKYEEERALSLLIIIAAIVIIGAPILIVIASNLIAIIFSLVTKEFNLINIVLLIIFFIFFIGVLFCFISIYSKRDLRIKRDFFSDFFGIIYKLADIKWANANISPDYFVEMMKNHKLININKNVFAIDDKFSCLFHNVKFEIYEISNKNSLMTITKNLIIFSGMIFVVTFLSFAISFPVYYILRTIIHNSIINHAYSHLLVFAIVEIILISIIKVLLHIINGKKLSLNFDRFKGLLIEFQCNKQINAHTIIIENNNENIFVKLFLSKNYHKIELEDEKFNSRFSVYSTNELEARYALTTAMMERLLNLEQSFCSKYIRASFKDDKLILAIQADKDLFQLGNLLKKTNLEMYQTMVSELTSILKITDALNLNNDTGL